MANRDKCHLDSSVASMSSTQVNTAPLFSMHTFKSRLLSRHVHVQFAGDKTLWTKQLKNV